MAGWHLIRHRLARGHTRRPGFSWCVVGIVAASTNAVLLLLFISACGEILRSDGRH